MVRRSFRWLMLLLIAAGLVIPVTIIVNPKAGYTQEEKKETGKKKKGKKGKKGETKDDLKYRYQIFE